MPAREGYYAGRGKQLEQSVYEKEVEIKNTDGLHMRPAMQFVDMASKFDCDITVSNGPTSVDGKSIMQMSMLAATIGTKLKIRTEGDDAKEAIGLLVEIAGIAFSNREKLKQVDFLSSPIERYTMDIVIGSPLRDKVVDEVRKAILGRTTQLEFVKEIGKRLETNFGFMFDWRTGEDYPEDDPRRRA